MFKLIIIILKVCHHCKQKGHRIQRCPQIYGFIYGAAIRTSAQKAGQSNSPADAAPTAANKYPLFVDKDHYNDNKIMALDLEKLQGVDNKMLPGKVAVCNLNGTLLLLAKYKHDKNKIKLYMTAVSGITKEDIENGITKYKNSKLYLFNSKIFI